MLFNILQCAPMTKNYHNQNVTSAEGGKPCFAAGGLRLCSLEILPGFLNEQNNPLKNVDGMLWKDLIN